MTFDASFVGAHQTLEKDRLFIAMFWPETNGKDKFIAGITDFY